jgi:hypothetical protein
MLSSRFAPFSTPVPPCTPAAEPIPPAIASGGSSMICARAGIARGRSSSPSRNCEARLTTGSAGRALSSGLGGAGGGPGAASHVINARGPGIACGQIMGATTAEATSSVSPVIPINAVQSRLVPGPDSRAITSNIALPPFTLHPCRHRMRA